VKKLLIALGLVAVSGCNRPPTPAAPSLVGAPSGDPSPTASLSGVVFEETDVGNRPLEGVTVIVTPPPRTSTSFTVTTDANGLYRFSAVPAVASQVDLLVISGSYATFSRRLTVSGDTQFDIELVRRPVYALSGVVTEVTAGETVPIEGVQIYVWTCDSRTNCAASQYLSTITGSRGAYNIPGVWSGDAAGVLAYKTGYRVDGDPPPDCEGCDRLVTLDSDTQLNLQMVRVR